MVIHLVKYKVTYFKMERDKLQDTLERKKSSENSVQMVHDRLKRSRLVMMLVTHNKQHATHTL